MRHLLVIFKHRAISLAFSLVPSDIQGNNLDKNSPIFCSSISCLFEDQQRQQFILES